MADRMGKVIVVFVDMLQAESRALISFLDQHQIVYEVRSYSETVKSDKKIHETYPNFTCPFFVKDIALGGGHTICRYLANKYLPQSGVYPSHKVNAKKR